MTIDEAKRLLGVKTNVALAARLGLEKTAITKWRKRRRSRVPSIHLEEINRLAGVRK